MGSVGKQESQQRSQSSGESFISPQQVPFLDQLFGAASSLAGQQLGPIQAQANQLSEGLLTSGQQFVSGLQGAAGGVGAGVESAISGLLNFGQPGNATEALLGPNPALGGQIDALSAAIQQNLAATSGTIGGQATLQGGTGGSRQALATGLAGQEAERQFGQGATQLFAQDFAARQQLAPQLLAQQQAALGAAGGLGIAGQQAQTQAAGIGLDSLSNLFNLGLAPFQSAFSPLLNLAAIIGPPTVLSTQQATGQQDSSAFQLGFLNLGGGGAAGGDT